MFIYNVKRTGILVFMWIILNTTPTTPTWILNTFTSTQVHYIIYIYKFFIFVE